MNTLNAIGRLGRDAELRYTQAQKPVMSFPVAIESGWGENKVTTWVRCTLWGDRGPKLVEFIKKGDRIGIQGEISLSEFEGKDGLTRTTLECNIREVTLLGEKREAAAPPAPPARPAPPKAPAPQAPAPEDFGDDDIPF